MNTVEISPPITRKMQSFPPKYIYNITIYVTAHKNRTCRGSLRSKKPMSLSDITKFNNYIVPFNSFKIQNNLTHYYASGFKCTYKLLNYLASLLYPLRSDCVCKV